MTEHPLASSRLPRTPRIAAALLGLLLTGPAAHQAFAATDSLRFRVFLDRDPIGEHSFQVAPAANGPGQNGKQVLSKASFDVNVLFFNAYRYRHESREEWRDGCLERIRASTDDNGTAYTVAGDKQADTLNIQVNGEARRLPHCVSTFAYWDRDFLKRPRLFNPQTGELLDVQVTAAGTEPRVFQGRTVEAERYRLRANSLDITLWYTPDGRWIGLESDTGKGRTLRYERI